jgi:glycosyltransferase involved in cell wall biosynthesis
MDINAFASSIDQLLTDKSLARTMGEAGFKLVSANYDFDRYLAGLESLFATVSSEKLSTASPC